MKRLLAICALALALLLGLSALASAAVTVSLNGGTETTADTLELALNSAALDSATTLTISGGDLASADWDYLKNRRAELTGLRELTVTAGVNSAAPLPDELFRGHTALTTVRINKAYSIGASAFQDCTSLTTADLPQASTVNEYAFQGCAKLTRAVLPLADTLKKGAFLDCNRLDALILGLHDPRTGRQVFDNCPALRTIQIPAASYFVYDHDGSGTWEGRDLRVYALCATVNSSTFADHELSDLLHDCGIALTDLTSLDLNTGEVTAEDWDYLKGQYRAGNLPRLTTLTASPNMYQVADLPEDLLANHDALTTVVINLAQTVGARAFQNCGQLTTFSFPSAQTINAEACSGCDRLTVLELPRVQTIGEKAFYSCTQLPSLTLPQATQIGASAFAHCDRLASLELPQAQTIGEQAFYVCPALTQLELPQARIIEADAFNSCIALAAASLPQAASLGATAFSNCTDLKNLTLGAAPPAVADFYTFFNCPNPRTLHIPAAAVNAYRTDPGYDQKTGKWYDWKIPVTTVSKIANTPYEQVTAATPQPQPAPAPAVQSAVLKLRLGSTAATKNDAPLTLDIAPYAVNGTTLVPLRVIGEQGLGAQVGWSGQTVTVNQHTFTIGQDNVAVKANRTLVPLRYIAETLGAVVQYTAADQPIVITF